MTDLLASSAPRPAGSANSAQRPAALGGLLAGVGAGLAGGLLCTALAVIGWLGGDGGDAPNAARIGLGFWLLANGVPMDLAGARLGLVPLGLTVGALGLLVAGGRWIARTCALRRIRDVCFALAALAAGYTGCGFAIALLARTEVSASSLGHAAVAPGVVALVGGGAGLFVAARIGRRSWRRLPEEVHAACLGGVAGVAALVTGGAFLLALALALNFERVSDLTVALAPGVVGAVPLTLLSVAYVPNAIIYAAAFAAGPGFVVGEGTAVTVTGVEVGPLPMFPLLAALPASTPDAWVMTVLAIPLAAGAVAGVVAVHRRPVFAYDMAAVRGAVAGAAGGVLFAVLALASGGSAGPGRLSQVGPSVVEVALVGVLTLALSGAAAALLTTVLSAWRARRTRAAATARANEPDPAADGADPNPTNS